MFEKTISPYEYLLLFVFAVASFLLSSPIYYPFLNSDIAVHVLMSNDFSFQNDLYYWSQDRLGSILPMCAYLVKQVLNVPPIWAISIVKWLFLFIGAAAFWRFIPNRTYRLAFSVLWFFPVYELRFLLLPGHPYGEQLALFGLSLVCFDKGVLKNNFHFFPFFLVFSALSIWTSDFSIILYALLAAFFIKPIISLFKEIWGQRRLWIILTSLLIMVLSGAFLLYAKLNAFRDPTYTLDPFASPKQLLHSISLVWFYTKNVLLFQSITFWNSIAFYGTLFLIGICLFKYRSLSVWGRYFLASTVIGFLFVLSLRWLSINDVMLKYFIPAFLTLWIGLFSNDYKPTGKWRWPLVILCVVLPFSSLNTLLVLYQGNEELRINYADIDSIDSGEPLFIIGEYWHSYVLSIANPDQIITTPHDQHFIRNRSTLNAVLNADTVIIVKNNWLENAPDTLMQYHHILIATGTEWSEGKFNLASYKNLGEAGLVK